MATTLSVPVTVMQDSGVCGITEAYPSIDEGGMAKVKYKCALADHYTLIGDLMGTWVSSGNIITRTPPFAYPPAPLLTCQSIESVEFIGPPKLLAGVPLPYLFREKAIVTAIFKRVTYEFDGPDAYSTTTFGCNGEVLTLPETTYRFADGTPTNTPIGLTMPQMEVTYTRHRMPFLPLSQVASLQGQVNNAAFTIGGYPFAAGYLLFCGADVSVQSTAAYAISYEVGYKFLYRSQPWNYSLHPDRTTGFAVVTDGNGNSPFTAGDFTTLP